MIAAILPGSEVTAVDASNLEDVEQKVTLHVRGKVPQFARAEGDALDGPARRRKEHMVRDYAPLADAQARRAHLRAVDAGRRLDGALAAGREGEERAAGVEGLEPLRDRTTWRSSRRRASLRVKTTVTLAKTRIPAREYPAFRAWCEEVDRALGQRATVTVK